ncbi:hypothetical protein [Pseudomonas oryzihabitans]|uniref:hypothetical protein n=1 Tax=Pseudomonas oryzihabitans TaxID=47885 RepID=UPI002895B63F|nr:hypothetical protein [Pseudomonas oryzihabitans]MDT3723221.1 hypothetical protein [Pseudomonas oryzihabitans]
MKPVGGSLGSKAMSIYVPDLIAELVPAKAAAGFEVGDDFNSILKRVGFVGWHNKDSELDGKIYSNTGWIGVRSRSGFPGGPYTLVQSLIYLDDVVCLEFEENFKLYRIDVGRGYRGGFFGVRPGDELRALERAGFDVFFNDMDDNFLLIKEGKVLEGISFSTNYRSSLSNAPDQIVEYISIHDWSLR